MDKNQDNPMEINRNRPTYPLAYCPPGSICGYYLHPRALPPVTIWYCPPGSRVLADTDGMLALQATECVWIMVM